MRRLNNVPILFSLLIKIYIKYIVKLSIGSIELEIHKTQFTHLRAAHVQKHKLTAKIQFN